MQAYFLSSAQVPFTGQDLINCLDIDEEDKDKKAKQFLDQAIRNLGNNSSIIVCCLNIIAILILGVKMRSCFFFPTPDCVFRCFIVF